MDQLSHDVVNIDVVITRRLAPGAKDEETLWIRERRDHPTCCTMQTDNGAPFLPDLQATMLKIVNLFRCRVETAGERTNFLVGRMEISTIECEIGPYLQHENWLPIALYGEVSEWERFAQILWIG